MKNFHRDAHHGIFVRPSGRYAYAFTNAFLMIFDVDQDLVSTQLGNTTWPDSSFLPYAVDSNRDSIIAVFGYVLNSNNEHKPCLYLLSVLNSTFIVMDHTWAYSPSSSNAWQSLMASWNVDTFLVKNVLSVSIDNDGNQTSRICTFQFSMLFRTELFPSACADADESKWQTFSAMSHCKRANSFELLMSLITI